MAAHQAPRPWDSPGKNTGVGCHFLLQCVKVKRASEFVQSSPTLRDPMDCSLPGSSVHGILQARTLEWAAIAFSTSLLYILDSTYKWYHTIFAFLCLTYFTLSGILDSPQWPKPLCELENSLHLLDSSSLVAPTERCSYCTLLTISAYILLFSILIVKNFALSLYFSFSLVYPN